MKISFFKFVFAVVFVLSPFIVLAGTGQNMSGWAWSDNIGWISFNCTNELNSCAQSDYGVNYDSETGLLTGYAWANPVDGTGVVSPPASVPTTENFSVPGTYSWTVPDGVTSIQLEMIGAGGNGGDGNMSWVNGGNGPGGGGGGGSGAYGTKTLTVLPGQTYQIIVGAPSSSTTFPTIFSGNGINLVVGSGANGGVGSSGVGGSAGPGGAAGSGFTTSSSGVNGSPGVAGGYTFDCGGGFSYGGDGGAGASNPHGGTGGIGGVDKCRSTGPAGDGGAGGLGAGGGGASGWLNGDYGGPNSGGSGGNAKVSLLYQGAGTGGTGGAGGTTSINTNNIGWIQFGFLSLADMPFGDGTVKQNAKMDSSGNLTGWAKALSADPATGWDGFISLSGTWTDPTTNVTGSYGVNLTNTASTFITASVDKGFANMFAWIPKFFNTAYASTPSQRFAWGSDVVGWVDFSGVVVNATLSPIPTNVSATAGACTTHSITVSWTAPTAGADSYNVYRSTTAGGPYMNITNVTGTSYTNDSSYQPPVFGTTYYYAVSSIKNNIESEKSAEASVVAPLAVCPVIDGGWSNWSTCSGGIQTRTCTNPLPVNGGADCSLLDGGNSSQTCVNTGQCPDGQHLDAPLPSGKCVDDGTPCANGIGIVGESPGCVRKPPGYQNN